MTLEAKDMSGNRYSEIRQSLRKHFPALLGNIDDTPAPMASCTHLNLDICDSIERRLSAINKQVISSVNAARPEIERAVRLFLRWMNEGTIVRVIGAGRARLAAVIPANRLAHGGARVYVQDDIIPMPHTIKGGGIIAASASGKTPSVLSVLRSARETKDIQIVGVAAVDAQEFKNYCDIFIGIEPELPGFSNPLRALADSEEYVISELLDAMVVAAGKLGGFVDTLWRMRHENIGPATGPYDFKRNLR